MNLRPKLPCEVCGGRDVEVVAAVPRLNRDSPHTHNLRVHHVGGRLCWVGIVAGPIGATTKRLDWIVRFARKEEDPSRPFPFESAGV